MKSIRDRGARAAGAARRRGVTFIELIGVLVVAIIIIAGALALYSEANTSSRTNQLVVALGALTGSVRALHANVGRYSADASTYQNLLDVLVSANAVPPGMLVTGSAGDYIVRHAFGGHIFVYGVGQEFIITADELDEDICIRIATESTAKSSSGLQRVVIGGDSGHAVGTAAPDSSVPGADLRYASLVNRSGATTTENNFYFTYGTTSAGSAAGLPISPNSADDACSAAANSNSISWLYQ